MLKIRGQSLYPELTEGDYVLAAGFPFPASKIKAGDVIVFCQPSYGMLVKRVHQVLDTGKAFDVRGTQIVSTDSRNFGPVPCKNVSGKVIWHIRKNNRGREPERD